MMIRGIVFDANPDLALPYLEEAALRDNDIEAAHILRMHYLAIRQTSAEAEFQAFRWSDVTLKRSTAGEVQVQTGVGPGKVP